MYFIERILAMKNFCKPFYDVFYKKPDTCLNKKIIPYQQDYLKNTHKFKRLYSNNSFAPNRKKGKLIIAKCPMNQHILISAL